MIKDAPAVASFILISITVHLELHHLPKSLVLFVKWHTVIWLVILTGQATTLKFL